MALGWNPTSTSEWSSSHGAEYFGNRHDLCSIDKPAIATLGPARRSGLFARENSEVRHHCSQGETRGFREPTRQRDTHGDVYVLVNLSVQLPVIVSPLTHNNRVHGYLGAPCRIRVAPSGVHGMLYLPALWRRRGKVRRTGTT